MFGYTFYYKVYNTWSTEAFGPKPDDVNHIYATLNMTRDTEFTKEEISTMEEALRRIHMENDSDVSAEDVVFITKEEYESGTGGDSKSISFDVSPGKEPTHEYNH